jgi:WD40 repeat protein
MITYSPNGEYIASVAGEYESSGAGTDDSVRIWRVSDSQAIATYHKSPIRYWRFPSSTAVAFSPDGASVLSGDARGGMYLWQIP